MIGQQSNWSSTNFSSSDLHANRRSFYADNQTQLLLVQSWCIFTLVCGVVGNSTVLLVYISKWRTLKWPDGFVISLAIGDFIESVQSPLLWIWNVSGWSYHAVGRCKTIWFIGCMCLYSSALLLIFVSVDRYTAVKRPFDNRELNSKRLIILTCLITISIGSFYMFGDRVGIYNTGDEHWICYVNITKYDYFAEVALIEFFVQVLFPLVVMAILYAMIMYELQKSTRKMEGYMSSTEKSRRNTSERKTCVILFTTVAAFLVTITPLRLFSILTVFDILPHQNYNAVYVILACFSMLNPCLNPFLYGRLQTTFRSEIKQIITRVKMIFSNLDPFEMCKKNSSTSRDNGVSRDLRKKHALTRQGNIDSSMHTTETKKCILKESSGELAIKSIFFEKDQANQVNDLNNTALQIACVTSENMEVSSGILSDRETTL